MLREDHREVDRLVSEVERARDPARAQELGEQIIEELSRHAAVEEQVFYPLVERALPATASALLKSLEAHHAAKSILAEVDRLQAGSDRYVPKLLVLADAVRTHVAEEEQELFPQVSAALSSEQLSDIGEVMAQAKRAAPTKPHPHAPDTPPGNFLNMAVGILDQARAAGERAIQRITGRDDTHDGASPSAQASSAARTATSGVSKAAKQVAKAGKKASKASKASKKAATPAKRAAGGAKKASAGGKKAAKRSSSTGKKAATKAAKATRKAAKKATKKAAKRSAR